MASVPAMKTVREGSENVTICATLSTADVIKRQSTIELVTQDGIGKQSKDNYNNDKLIIMSSSKWF